MNKNLFFIIAFISLLYLGKPLLHSLGWEVGSSYASFYEKTHPAFWILICIFVIAIYKSRKKYTIELKVLIMISISLALSLRQQESNLSFYINSLILPTIFIVSLKYTISTTKRTSAIIFKILIYFFIVNSLIAISERLLSQNLFSTSLIVEKTFSSGSDSPRTFRSSALLGHPLNNALVTSIIMSFILISQIKNIRKYILFSLGFVAILCFNTRSSIVGWIVFVLIYILREITSTKKTVSYKIQLITIITIITFAATIAVFNFGFGDRLLDLGLMDDNSTAYRLKIFNVFSHVSFLELIFFGYGVNTLNELALNEGLIIVENFWIIFIFRLGAIITLILVFLYSKLLKTGLKKYSSFQSFFVIFVFIILASTNNSLAAGTATPLVTLFACIYSFNSIKY